MDTKDLLIDMMRFDSSEKSVANDVLTLAIDYLNENGIEGTRLSQKGFDSFVATIGQGERTLILNGHLDVVLGKPEQFEPYEKEGLLYGRGGADMKAGCAAMINAFIKLSKEKLNSKVMLQVVTDEEIGGLNCSKYLVDQGYLGDFVICTEPTQLLPSIQSKGIIRMNVISKGVPAHGSRPWEGENAILNAYRNYERIDNLPILKMGTEFYESSSINLAKIKGGNIYNRVPDECKMGFDIRFIPCLDPEDIISAINEVVDGEVQILSIDHGVNVQADDPDLLIFKSIVEDIRGQKVNIAVQHGGSDARFYAEKGISAIEFGPVGHGWHGDEEYVDIESIYTLENILVKYGMTFK